MLLIGIFMGSDSLSFSTHLPLDVKLMLINISSTEAVVSLLSLLLAHAHVEIGLGFLASR